MKRGKRFFQRSKKKGGGLVGGNQNPGRKGEDGRPCLNGNLKGARGSSETPGTRGVQNGGVSIANPLAGGGQEEILSGKQRHLELYAGGGCPSAKNKGRFQGRKWHGKIIGAIFKLDDGWKVGRECEWTQGTSGLGEKKARRTLWKKN